MNQSCKSCRFWDRFEFPVNPDTGDCRRHAPVFREVPHPERLNETIWGCAFPVTKQYDWCGDYEPRIPNDEGTKP